MTRPTYYIYEDILALRSDPQREDRDTLRRRVAANVGDSVALLELLGDLPEAEEFYPGIGVTTPGTTEAIDTFLTNFSSVAPAPDDAPLVVAPAVDYATMLEIEGKRTPAAAETDSAAEESDSAAGTPADSLEGEEKAAELIKKRSYGAAFEIIRDLSLKNPEKSIYFADQMRFLKKLMVIEAKKSN